MHLLLTKFHMYLENVILQVTNTNTWRNSLKGAFPTLICAKEQGIRPSNQFNQGKTPWGSNPGPAQGLPHEGGGKVA
jgi:hypothetical protein